MNHCRNQEGDVANIFVLFYTWAHSEGVHCMSVMCRLCWCHWAPALVSATVWNYDSASPGSIGCCQGVLGWLPSGLCKLLSDLCCNYKCFSSFFDFVWLNEFLAGVYLVYTLQILIWTYRVQLTNCPRVLTKCQQTTWIKWHLRSLNLLVSVISLMLWSKRVPGSWTSVTEASFTKLWLSTFVL